MPADAPDIIALCGFMAAGKSTVGAALAARLGCPCVDTDARIVEAAGLPIPAIFAAEGEPGFRARERRAVAEAAALDRAVVALGGGVVRDPVNVAVLRARGAIVRLLLSPSATAERILCDGRGRPMIDDHIPTRTPEAVATRVAELMAEREPDYAAAADLTVPADGRTADELAADILAALELRWTRP